MAGKSVLIAGATGYLGQHLIREAKRQGYRVRALARNSDKLAHLDKFIDDLFVGEVTNPYSLNGICDKIDYVISALGITRQKDGFTYMDVDYQGNKNLLHYALSAGVSRFEYVSVYNAHLMSKLKIIEAKEKFVRELIASGLDYIIVRPTGFFSDMLEFLRMANKGTVYLFGDGRFGINPIHGQDLAERCVAALGGTEQEILVGGPKTFTHNQIAELAFETLNRKPKISYIPLWLVRAYLPVMRLFTSVKTYGPIEFMMTALSMDGVAPPYGKEKLKVFFEDNALASDSRQ
ncbi:MAG: SDR family oxidoreductase [Candidatus Zixiibacteriota bacterium]|nr:MAG: SDR family oxidoreductase [candidate division Zixibacteria bacterium]